MRKEFQNQNFCLHKKCTCWTLLACITSLWATVQFKTETRINYATTLNISKLRAIKKQ